MELKELTFGIGSILRDRVSGWASSDSGTNHVYPDMPPLDLAQSSYPRAMVDTTAHNPQDQSVEKDITTGDVLIEVTVFTTNSADLVQLIGDCHDAVISYHDHPDYQEDANGDPLLAHWGFLRDGTVGPTLEREAGGEQGPGFTRYQKTAEFEFTHVTQSVIT